MTCASVKGEREMAFLGLQLETYNLKELPDFYVNQLGLTLLDSSPERLDFQAGQTKLCFVPAEGEIRPVYRFTLNLAQSAPGQTLYDPSGNRIDVTGDAGSNRGIVRFSLPVADLAATAKYLQTELEFLTSSSGPEPETWLVGDEDWSFLLTQQANTKAYLVIASVPGKIITETKVLEYPYYIHRWHS
jgi:hypothetical protein